MSVTKKIFFTIFLFILMLTGIEIIGLFIKFNFDISVARFNVPMLVDADNVLKDPKLFWKFKPANSFHSRWEPAGMIKINSQGWRDDEFVLNKPPKLKRIACIGDSSTFGYRRRPNEIFSNILEKKLNLQKINGNDWDVQNYGVPGYTIHQGRIVFQDYALKYKPDFVVTMFGINDSRRAVFDDEKYKISLNAFTKIEKYLQKLFFYKLLTHYYFKLVEKKVSEKSNTFRMPIEKFISYQNFFFEESKKQNFIYIVMTQPYNPISRNSEFAVSIEKYNAALIDFARANNIALIDIAAEFNEYYEKTKKSLVWDYCHPDDIGNDYIAERILKIIEKPNN